jgi:hypothetical protein
MCVCPTISDVSAIDFLNLPATGRPLISLLWPLGSRAGLYLHLWFRDSQSTRLCIDTSCETWQAIVAGLHSLNSNNRMPSEEKASSPEVDDDGSNADGEDRKAGSSKRESTLLGIKQ